MLRSESTAQLAAALAAAQGQFPKIPRDRTVRVKLRSGGEYTFAYAPLDTILECVRPALAKNGLAVTQAVVADEKGTEFVRTTLIHSSGEWIAGDQPLFVGSGDNAAQAYGGGVTYARRYGLTSLLCIAAEDDDDANGEGFERVPSRRQAAEPRRPKSDKDAKQDGEPGIYLSESQKRLLLAKAKAAGLEHEEGTDAALVQRYNRIDTRNINQVLADLSALRDQQQAEVPA